MREMQAAIISLTLAAILIVGLAAPVYAVDGAIEINQARALAGGVTATDTAGFPVTLDSPGTYVLTGTLTTPVANVDGIDITSADVTLDLNGFSLIGPGVAAFAFFGIDGNGNVRIAVKNGNVVGFGWRGISLAFECLIDHVVSMNHDDAGINCNSQSIIQNSVANNNGAWGINAGGQVVGWSDAATGLRAFLWDNGVMTDLGDLPGGTDQSVARSVNDSGQVVGGEVSNEE